MSYRKWQGYRKLHNWPQLLLKFRSVLDIVLSRNYQTSQEGNHSRRLLKFLQINRATIDEEIVMSNLIATAMHLAFLKETHFAPATFPDLPEQLNSAVIQ